MSAVYAAAPGFDLHPQRAEIGALFDALEAAEGVAHKALRRAADLQPGTVRTWVPA